MTITAEAPVRISFCGGGTDIAEYYEWHGGVVLSTSIDKYSHVELQAREDGGVEISSPDFGQKIKGNVGEKFSYDGTLDLLKAAVNWANPKKGFTLTTYQDVPAASGLGTSASMAVAVIGAVRMFRKQSMDRQEIAELAYRLERDELHYVTGKQDQYAATFGGLNLIEFTQKSTVVKSVNVDPAKKKELHDHLLLMNIGGAHVSGDLQEFLITQMKRRKEMTIKGLEGLKDLTYQMHDDLVTGRLEDFGKRLHDAFLFKKMSSTRVSNEHIEAMYALARKHGALGGKISGAGGSGNMLLFCPLEKRDEIRTALEEVGGEEIQFAFEDKGCVVEENR